MPFHLTSRALRNWQGAPRKPSKGRIALAENKSTSFFPQRSAIRNIRKPVNAIEHKTSFSLTLLHCHSFAIHFVKFSSFISCRQSIRIKWKFSCSNVSCFPCFPKLPCRNRPHCQTHKPPIPAVKITFLTYCLNSFSLHKELYVFFKHYVDIKWNVKCNGRIILNLISSGK